MVKVLIIHLYFTLCVGECAIYDHANFQDATIYKKKVTKEKLELLMPPPTRMNVTGVPKSGIFSWDQIVCIPFMTNPMDLRCNIVFSSVLK